MKLKCPIELVSGPLYKHRIRKLLPFPIKKHRMDLHVRALRRTLSLVGADVQCPVALWLRRAPTCRRSATASEPGRTGPESDDFRGRSPQPRAAAYSL